MTLLTDDELKAVRERDAEWIVGLDTEFVEALHIHPVPTKELVWPREWAVHDRRALLRHIDALTEKLRELADECAECEGSGVYDSPVGPPEPCPACADIRALLPKETP